MKRTPLLLLWVLAALVVVGCEGDVVQPPRDLLADPIDIAATWQTGSPAAEGFDPGRLDAALRAAAELENIRALLIVRNGRVLLEEYFNGTTADSLLDVRSVTKTATALVLGAASDEGALDVEDEIADWLPADQIRPEHAGIHLRHLLTMTSGIQWTDPDNFALWVSSGRPVGYVLDLPVVAPPDAQFIYNTGGSHLLSVAVAEATGGNMLDYAFTRLLAPLGITDGRWATLGGQAAGGVGMALRARDLARLGQLVLQRGWSGDRQVISEAWMDEAFASRIALGEVEDVLRNGGYGYQVWTESAEPTAFVMWGFGGQFVWIVPSEALVVVGASRWAGIGYDGSTRQADALANVIREGVIPALR